MYLHNGKTLPSPRRRTGTCQACGYQISYDGCTYCRAMAFRIAQGLPPTITGAASDDNRSTRQLANQIGMVGKV